MENFITLVGTSNLWPDLNPADVCKQINKKKRLMHFTMKILNY